LLLRGKPFLLIVMRLIVSFIILFSLNCLGQEIKKKDWKVSVHLETDAENKFTFPVEIEGKNVPFSKTAIFTHKDIDRAKVFRNAEGTVGVVFRVEKRAANKLYNLQHTAKGRRLTAIVMGRIVDIIQVDEAKEDRLYVIWKGLNVSEVDYIEEEIKPLEIR